MSETPGRSHVAAERYTLREAEVELKRRECASYGHDYDVHVPLGGEIRRVVCQRCWRIWVCTPYEAAIGAST